MELLSMWGVSRVDAGLTIKGQYGKYILFNTFISFSLKLKPVFQLPLNPNIKIQILICCPYIFPVEVEERIRWSIH